ncbi:MAG TPA: hypothetical protein VFE53_16255 [Mucilaginibacter sp.]|nr:hypothetical protein [Mucilaginibacter sp.]
MNTAVNYLCLMVGNFTTTINGAEFQFHTMNVQRLQLFQVYVLHDGKKARFHVQRKGEGDFYITDIDHCPEPYRALEQTLSAAVLDYGHSLGAE